MNILVNVSVSKLAVAPEAKCEECVGEVVCTLSVVLSCSHIIYSVVGSAEFYLHFHCRRENPVRSF